MGWPHLTYPLQTDNFTSEGIVNNIIVPQKLNLWIYAFTGYTAAKIRVGSGITGAQAYSTGETTVPNIIHQIIMNSILQYMSVQHINYLSPSGFSGKMYPKFCSKVAARVYC